MSLLIFLATITALTNATSFLVNPSSIFVKQITPVLPPGPMNPQPFAPQPLTAADVNVLKSLGVKVPAPPPPQITFTPELLPILSSQGILTNIPVMKKTVTVTTINGASITGMPQIPGQNFVQQPSQTAQEQSMLLLQPNIMPLSGTMNQQRLTIPQNQQMGTQSVNSVQMQSIGTGLGIPSQRRTMGLRPGMVPQGQMMGQQMGNVPQGQMIGTQMGNIHQGQTMGQQMGNIPQGQMMGQQMGNIPQGQMMGQQMGNVPQGQTMGQQTGNVPQGQMMGTQLGNVPQGQMIGQQMGNVPQGQAMGSQTEMFNSEQQMDFQPGVITQGQEMDADSQGQDIDLQTNMADLAGTSEPGVDEPLQLFGNIARAPSGYNLKSRLASTLAKYVADHPELQQTYGMNNPITFDVEVDNKGTIMGHGLVNGQRVRLPEAQVPNNRQPPNGFYRQQRPWGI